MPPPTHYPGQSSGSARADNPIGEFFLGLFNVRFENLVTTKIVTVTYALLLLFEAVWCIAFLAVAFAAGDPTVILFALLGVPLLFIVSVATWRLGLEMYVVLFRLLEESRKHSALFEKLGKE